MDDAEYKKFVESAYHGRVLIGVDRVFARKVYTDIPISTIWEATGEAPYLEKVVVWFAFLASPLALLTSAVLAVLAFRWWAFLIVPVTFLWWMINRSMSVLGTSRIWFHTLVLIVAASVHFMNLLRNPWMSGFVMAFVFAMWSDRLLYCASTFFLRAFGLRNKRALEAFGEGITIRERTRHNRHNN